MAVHRRTLPVMVSSAFVVAWTVWWAWRMWPDSGGSWHFGAIHLAWAVAVVVLVFTWPHSRAQSSRGDLTGTANVRWP